MPDLNSVPPSPHALASQLRQASQQQMPPPPAPASPSLNILPSNQVAVNASTSSSLPSPGFQSATSLPGQAMGDNTGVGPGPGPLRHPRPITAADLHLQLEKEQEAVVNRLTRELSVLRAAQNASVVSNASSTSASASGTEPAPWSDSVSQQPSLGSSHYQPVRHQRTSSSASSRSLIANAGSVSATSIIGISSPAPIRPTAQPPIPIMGTGGVPLSRQNSSASRRSRTGSPSPAPHSLSGSYTHHHHHEPGSLPGYFASRNPATAASVPIPIRSQSGASIATTTSELSPGIMQATSRFEETALRRAELEEYKRENEALRRRVQELEKLVRDAATKKDEGGNVPQQQQPPQQQQQQRQQEPEQSPPLPQQTQQTQQQQVQQHPVTRARAASGASVSVRSVVGVGVPEEEVVVGESAASAATGRGGGVGREN